MTKIEIIEVIQVLNSIESYSVVSANSSCNHADFVISSFAIYLRMKHVPLLLPLEVNWTELNYIDEYVNIQFVFMLFSSYQLCFIEKKAIFCLSMHQTLRHTWMRFQWRNLAEKSLHVHWILFLQFNKSMSKCDCVLVRLKNSPCVWRFFSFRIKPVLQYNVDKTNVNKK